MTDYQDIPLFKDIWTIILNKLPLKSQVYLLSSCKYFRHNLFITDMLNTKKTLSDYMLKSHIFDKISKLCIDYKPVDVLRFKNTLTVLNCDQFTGIKQKHINELRLTELYATCENDKITNLNHMKDTLKILHCGCMFNSISQQGISELRLVEFNTNNNHRITNVNHMRDTLKVLHCMYGSGIDQNGIYDLSLTHIYYGGNKKITDISFMKDTLICANNYGRY